MSTFLYILIMIITFACGTTLSQDFVTADNFKDKIAKDITVVEFWAGWNESNQFNELNKSKQNSVIYNISGQAIREPNGLYIQNGKVKFKIK